MLTAGHARALLGSPDRAFQEHLARRAVAEGLSVRDVEDAVRARNELAGTGAPEVAEDTGTTPTANNAGKQRLRPPGLLELEELFSAHLDTRVQVTMGSSRGKVVIEFADLADLERIYRVITEGRPTASTM